jgi:hypothetical protein
VPPPSFVLKLELLPQSDPLVFVAPVPDRPVELVVTSPDAGAVGPESDWSGWPEEEPATPEPDCCAGEDAEPPEDPPAEPEGVEPDGVEVTEPTGV